MSEGTQYKKGDIIVFYRDGVKIVHQVEYVHESNGKMFYVTTGVNTETNQYVDSDLVSQDDVIGVVDLSKEAYLALEQTLENRYVPTIQAFGMTQNFQEFIKFLNEKNKYIDRAYYAVTKVAHDKGLKMVSRENHGIEMDIKEYIQACIEAYERGKYPGDAILTWKHEDCGHVWENSYNNLGRNIGKCPKCDSPYINQELTNDICEKYLKSLGYIKENTLYRREYSLKKIFPNLDIHPSVHVDGYVELNIKDKNGNFIKLAIEYQGRQHDRRPRIGFEAYKFLTHNLKLEEDSQKYEDLKEEWQNLLDRDEDKVDHFEIEKKNGFYLIVVNYNVKIEDRQQIIIDRFKKLTGFDLS